VSEAIRRTKPGSRCSCWRARECWDIPGAGKSGGLCGLGDRETAAARRRDKLSIGAGHDADLAGDRRGQVHSVVAAKRVVLGDLARRSHELAVHHDDAHLLPEEIQLGFDGPQGGSAQWGGAGRPG
jgi:hypothetical protein